MCCLPSHSYTATNGFARVQSSTSSQIYTLSERLHPSDNSMKVIPLTTFTLGQQPRPSEGNIPIMEEKPLKTL
ncbi:Protocadherin-11 X-linked, partial [Galemys pyrenaicus]